VIVIFVNNKSKTLQFFSIDFFRVPQKKTIERPWGNNVKKIGTYDAIG
jgi:hypothetical protein